MVWFIMKLRDIILGIAIMILTIFVVVYGISVFYPGVEYSDFCNEFKTAEIVETQERCEQIGGQWNAYEEEIRCVTTPCPQGYCDRDFTCRENYEDAQETRSRIIFFIALPLGIALLVLGGFVFGLEAVGAGLMGGGIGTILYGAGGYWAYSTDVLRFILSLLSLAAVIYLAYWFNKKSGKKK